MWEFCTVSLVQLHFIPAISELYTFFNVIRFALGYCDLMGSSSLIAPWVSRSDLLIPHRSTPFSSASLEALSKIALYGVHLYFHPFSVCTLKLHFISLGKHTRPIADRKEFDSLLCEQSSYLRLDTIILVPIFMQQFLMLITNTRQLPRVANR